MISRAAPRLIWLCALAAVPLAAGCAHHPPPTPAEQNNRLSGSEQKAGWRLLFDGTTLDQWRGYKMDTVPAGWKIVSGVLMKRTGTEDLVTKDEFANFELEFDWRIGSGGNAGVLYRGNEEYDHIYWTAPEYQLLDDLGHPDGRSRLTSAGAAYGLYPSPIGALKPIGEWNTGRIVVNGAHVEHWLNGKKLLEYELWSPDWEAKVKASKFAAWRDYGRLKSGHLAIQGDHDGVLALRNIKIRVLP